MPAMYAHYVFGAEVLPMFDESIQCIINKHRGLYNLGLQGPDFYFYDQLFYFRKKSLARIGGELHRQSCEFLLRFFERNGKERLDEASLAYVLGVIGHFSLDSTCHPHIDHWVKTMPYDHMRLETEFDRLLLENRGVNARSYRLGDCFASTPQEREVVARLYTGYGSKKDVKHLIRDYAFLKNIMRTPWDLQYKLYRGVMSMIGAGRLNGVFMGETDTKSDITNPKLVVLFEEAKPIFVKLVNNYMAHCVYKVPLDPYFKRDFEVLPEAE